MVAVVLTSQGLTADVVVHRSENFRLELCLSIPSGKTVALLGPNGSGKSTALAAIAGLISLDSGRILFNGVTLDDPATGAFVPPERRKAGVVFQNYLLFPHLSVLDNVAFGLRSRRIARGEANTRAREWIERIGLTGMENRKPADLSGGQSQRVAIARALAITPDLLLLDEPLSALDISTRSELRHMLKEHLTNFDGPRLLITHDPTEAFLLADEIHVIEDGTVTQVGNADEIRLRPRTQYAADLAGFNLIMGTARSGIVDTGVQPLYIANNEIAGPVLATIHPTAISLYLEPPKGSPRNSWSTTVYRVERFENRIRLSTGPPLPVTVEVTEQAKTELGLKPGTQIWVALKATEIGIQPGRFS